MFRITRFSAAIAVASASLLFAACGGDDDDDSGTTSTATTAATSAGQASQSGSPVGINGPTNVTTPAAADSGGAYYYDTSGGSTSSPAPGAVAIKVGSTGKGSVLTDAAGLTLYTWDTDTTPGKSGCNGSCATAWPPVVTTESAAPSAPTGASGAFTIITRDDGAKQVAYKGKPLYRFAADTKPGDVTGDGVGGTWHIAAP